MMLRSTLSPALTASWRDGVLAGLAPDGGLFVPTTLPHLNPEELAAYARLPFPELARELACKFLVPDVPREVVDRICRESFTFDVPLQPITQSLSVLELFHGPTCAFKDFGARFMSRLFRYFLGESDRRLTVLVATSGDTGSAVANAFHDASPQAPIRVVVLFPKGKVSLVQEKQMTTLGGNVTALEVEGSFDDCQRLVKQALGDSSLAERATLTSANSINIARLLPQMFYYVYAALISQAPPTFSVPSGNLGNLTGGLLAALIGVPIEHFIAATNANSVFPDYLHSGAYQPHPSRETISNAMDVGDPSNFARIMSLYDGDLARMRDAISGFSISESETVATIRRVYDKTGYILDPHTAVGVAALDSFSERLKGSAVVLATAHPAKFSSVVAHAIGHAPMIPPQLRSALDAHGEKTPLPLSYDRLKEVLLSQ